MTVKCHPPIRKQHVQNLFFFLNPTTTCQACGDVTVDHATGPSPTTGLGSQMGPSSPFLYPRVSLASTPQTNLLHMLCFWSHLFLDFTDCSHVYEPTTAMRDNLVILSSTSARATSPFLWAFFCLTFLSWVATRYFLNLIFVHKFLKGLYSNDLYIVCMYLLDWIFL